MPDSANTYPSDAELIERAKAMIPDLKARAPHDEEMGSLDARTASDMVKYGLTKIVQPKRWGGFERSLKTLASVEINLARGDHSVGWCHGIWSGHSHHLALFDDRAAKDVWGEDQDALIASPYNPLGQATSRPDGYVLSGEWKYSSGCDHAQWSMLGAFADADPKKFLTLLVPRSQVEIIHDWQVFGLKGTGSKTVKVIEAFVPSYRTVPFGPGTEYFAFPGLQFNKHPSYRIPYMIVFNRAATAASIGSLEAMIEAFCDYARTKISVITTKSVAGHPDTQLAVGEAVATLDELKILAMHDLEALEHMAETNTMVDEDQLNAFRYRAQIVSERCVTAARALYEQSGGGGLYEEGSGLGRIYRNLIAARQHPASAMFRDSARAIGMQQFGQSQEKRLRF